MAIVKEKRKEPWWMGFWWLMFEFVFLVKILISWQPKFPRWQKFQYFKLFFTNLHIFYFLKVRSLEAVFPPNSIYWSLRQYLWWNYGNVASPHLGNISLEFQKLGCSTITFWRISNWFAGGTDDLLSINYEHSTMGASMMWSHVCK